MTSLVATPARSARCGVALGAVAGSRARTACRSGGWRAWASEERSDDQRALRAPARAPRPPSGIFLRAGTCPGASDPSRLPLTLFQEPHTTTRRWLTAWDHRALASRASREELRLVAYSTYGGRERHGLPAWRLPSPGEGASRGFVNWLVHCLTQERNGDPTSVLR